MTYNQLLLFPAIRKYVPNLVHLTQNQVDGIRLLTEDIDRKCPGMSVQYAAYMMATVQRETGALFQPVREGFTKDNDHAVAAVTRLFEEGRIKHNYALPDPITGQNYYGRGVVQITSKDNYVKGDVMLKTTYPDVVEKIKEHNLLGEFSLVNDPDFALIPAVASALLIGGMLQGMYTGKKLSDFDNKGPNGSYAYIGARTIINGLNMCVQVASFATGWEKALTEARS